jgi:hypothetical protein
VGEYSIVSTLTLPCWHPYNQTRKEKILLSFFLYLFSLHPNNWNKIHYSSIFTSLYPFYLLLFLPQELNTGLSSFPQNNVMWLVWLLLIGNP